METAVTGSALPFLFEMSLALSPVCRKWKAVKSWCYFHHRPGSFMTGFSFSVMARLLLPAVALQLPTATRQQGRGVGLWPAVEGS